MKQTIGSEAAAKSRSVHDMPGGALDIWAFVLSFFVPVAALIFGIIWLAIAAHGGGR
ncbi:hypothetical protein GCM10022251_55550 [Phytohabitans flavus]|uniref:Uncharacterized protein n=1 Tax=Phytohabitans flavus TaxID=1076124 RepID=A0A6F8XQ70_9ACTN|nr:hypothetical protein [Phytohabitans flavus]BCB75973.1 hypothetical protein Pflav_023830 [Phytohabitans flavus]